MTPHASPTIAKVRTHAAIEPSRSAITCRRSVGKPLVVIVLLVRMNISIPSVRFASTQIARTGRYQSQREDALVSRSALLPGSAASRVSTSSQNLLHDSRSAAGSFASFAASRTLASFGSDLHRSKAQRARA
jgi:hypothetical protein